MSLQVRQGEFFSHARPVGLRQDDDAAADRRLRAADRRARSGSTATTSPRSRRTSATSTRCSSPTRCSSTSTSSENVAFGLRRRKVPKQEITQRVAEALELVALEHRAKDTARAALGRHAPARRARPRARQPPVGAAARRAARRARPPAAQADAGRAQAHPARGRDHVHLRDPRPGGGARDVGPDRGHARRHRPAARRARGDLRASREAVRGRLHRHLEPARRPPSRTAASGSAPARSCRRRCPTASPAAPRCSCRCGPRSCWIDELEPGMAEVEGTIAERVYLGTTTQLIVELGPGRAARGARAEHRRGRAPTTAGSWATASASGWRPEHGQVLR